MLASSIAGLMPKLKSANVEWHIFHCKTYSLCDEMVWSIDRILLHTWTYDLKRWSCHLRMSARRCMLISLPRGPENPVENDPRMHSLATRTWKNDCRIYSHGSQCYSRRRNQMKFWGYDGHRHLRGRIPVGSCQVCSRLLSWDCSSERGITHTQDCVHGVYMQAIK